MKQVSKTAVFIPIPLSSKRLKQRGYNQSFLLAKGLAKKMDIPVHDILLRKKNTKPQFGLSKLERKANMKDAFTMKRGIGNEYTTAFLVDDVLTTGTTLLEAAKILKQHGFQKVWRVTFARD